MKNYYLKQKVFSFTDSYKIYDADQNVIFYAKRKFFRPRVLSLHEAAGDRIVHTLKRRVFTMRPGYHLFDAENRRIAQIRKRFSFGRPKIDIHTDLGDYLIKGSVWAHDFTIETAKETLAVVRKKRLSWGDSYEIAIDEQADVPMMIAMVVMLDNLYHSRSAKKTTRGRR